MSRSPIKALEVHTSVRQVHAREACGLRYLGFLAATGAACWGIHASDLRHAAGLPYLIALLVMFFLFRPWHRGLHVDMDVMLVRTNLRLFGFMPIARRDYELAGRRLLVERRTSTVEAPADDVAMRGCLLLALPFPLSLLAQVGRGSNAGPRGVVQWVLCLSDEGTGAIEDLVPLQILLAEIAGCPRTLLRGSCPSAAGRRLESGFRVPTV